jgi:hypothetical protein
MEKTLAYYDTGTFPAVKSKGPKSVAESFCCGIKNISLIFMGWRIKDKTLI